MADGRHRSLPPASGGPLAARPRVAWLIVSAIALACGCAQQPGRAPHPSETRVRDLTAELAAAVMVSDAVDPGRPACAPLLGAGWLPPEQAAGGMTFAWTAAETAHLTLPISLPGPGHIVVRACGLQDGRDPRRLGVAVNGRDLGRRPLPREPAPLVFAAPAGLLRAGGNEVTLRVGRLVRPADAFGSADTRRLGALVDLVAFLPADAPDSAFTVDPYDEPGAILAAGRAVELRPARLAGAELRLAWDGAAAAPGDSLVAEVWAEAEAAPRFRGVWPVGPGLPDQARVALPAGMPPKPLLRLRMAGEGGASARRPCRHRPARPGARRAPARHRPDRDRHAAA